MSISIPSELMPFVDDLVATGAYSTPDDVVRDALAQMRDRRERFEELKASVLEAKAEVDRGEGLTLDIEDLLAEGRRMFTQRHGD